MQNKWAGTLIKVKWQCPDDWVRAFQKRQGYEMAKWGLAAKTRRHKMWMKAITSGTSPQKGNCMCSSLAAGQDAHASPYPPLKAPTMAMGAADLDLAAMADGCPVWWIEFSVASGGWPGMHSTCVVYVGLTKSNPQLHSRMHNSAQCSVSWHVTPMTIIQIIYKMGHSSTNRI